MKHFTVASLALSVVIFEAWAGPPQQQERPRPARYSEGSGLEWHGVFAVEGEDAKRRVFLCDPEDKSRRIEVHAVWSAYVLKEWRKYDGREIVAYSWNDETPVNFYLVTTADDFAFGARNYFY